MFFFVLKKAKDFIKNEVPCFVLGVGLEPTQPQWPRDFKSLVSTDSTIRAAGSCRLILCLTKVRCKDNSIFPLYQKKCKILHFVSLLLPLFKNFSPLCYSIKNIV